MQKGCNLVTSPKSAHPAQHYMTGRSPEGRSGAFVELRVCHAQKNVLLGLCSNRQPMQWSQSFFSTVKDCLKLQQ